MFELDEPFVGKEELNYLTQAIDSGWISAMGPFVKKFEDKFAEYIGVKYAVSCASGTSAISLLCPTLKIKPGDEVILQSLTFTADAWAMHLAGAKIIFADCAKNTFSIDPEDVRKKITKKTKIISPTHLYGRPSRMDELREICDKNNIYLIEDCCQAMGSKYKDKMVGSIGDFNFYSFHNKLIASGEGGMITTNNKDLADRFEKLKNPPAVNRPEERDGFTEISMNHRLSNLHAAVGLAQLERLEQNIKKKLRMAEIYDEIFNNAKGISLIKEDDKNRTVWWRYTILLDPKINVAKFKQKALESKIVVREGYLPLHKHPFFKEHKKLHLPNAERLGDVAIDIPSSFKLKEDEITLIAQTLKKIAKDLI